MKKLIFTFMFVSGLLLLQADFASAQYYNYGNDYVYPYQNNYSLTNNCYYTYANNYGGYALVHAIKVCSYTPSYNYNYGYNYGYNYVNYPSNYYYNYPYNYNYNYYSNNSNCINYGSYGNYYYVHCLK